MTGRRPDGWRVERSTGSADDLLGPWPPAPQQQVPMVRAGRLTGRPALVLGSTQDASVVDHRAAAAAGVDVLRRTTGGGAVLVAPDAQVWMDLWLPRRHDRWDDDIVRAAAWVGEAWMAALGNLGIGGLRLHHGPATRGALPDLVCFAGLGPGELTVAGAKVMGLAQRRTSAGARFHTSAPLVWDPAPLLSLLGPPLSAPWDDVAVGLRSLVGTGSPAAALSDDDLITATEDAVIAALP